MSNLLSHRPKSERTRGMDKDFKVYILLLLVTKHLHIENSQKRLQEMSGFHYLSKTRSRESEILLSNFYAPNTVLKSEAGKVYQVGQMQPLAYSHSLLLFPWSARTIELRSYNSACIP